MHQIFIKIFLANPNNQSQVRIGHGYGGNNSPFGPFPGIQHLDGCAMSSQGYSCPPSTAAIVASQAPASGDQEPRRDVDIHVEVSINGGTLKWMFYKGTSQSKMDDN